MQKEIFEGMRLFWSPSVRWEKLENEVRIEMFSYSGIALSLFPEFYFATQKGIQADELLDRFSSFDSRKLRAFVNDLVAKKIIVTSILSPAELFYPQRYLFDNRYSEKIAFDAEELKSYKEKQLVRSFDNCRKNKISLKQKVEYPSFIKDRRTCRRFNENSRLSFDTFSQLISVFRQNGGDGEIKYYYASAGGLYPIDIFIYIKEDRVENLKHGLYYYSPLDNSLSTVNDTDRITDDAHFYTNKAIYNSSAFSIFFVYNCEANMPKYGAMGYFFGCIDCGVMVGAFTQVAELYNVGMCSIGDMDFMRISKLFKLNENQTFMHAIEVGLKSDQDETGAYY